MFFILNTKFYSFIWVLFWILSLSLNLVTKQMLTDEFEEQKILDE